MTSSEKESDFTKDTEQEEELEDEQTAEPSATEETTQTETPDSPNEPETAPPSLPPVQIPDRYEIHRCKVSFSITMLEDDGNPEGRSVLIGVRNDEDVPLTELVRASDLPALLPALIALQARLENDLPQRQEAMRLKLEEARRKQITKAPSKPKPRPATVSTTAATAGAMPTEQQDTIPQHEENAVVESTPLPRVEEKATIPVPQTTAKTPTKAKKASHQEAESPVEQMTLFG